MDRKSSSVNLIDNTKKEKEILIEEKIKLPDGTPGTRMWKQGR
jgi:hypothetical protein